MSAPTTPLASTPDVDGRALRAVTLEHGDFGLGGARLVVEPGTPPDELLWDALCLVHSALGVFDSILAGGDDDHDLPESYFAGLYVLRQACIVLSAAQLTPAQGAAAATATAAAATGAAAHGAAEGGAQ